MLSTFVENSVLSTNSSSGPTAKKLKKCPSMAQIKSCHSLLLLDPCQEPEATCAHARCVAGSLQLVAHKLLRCAGKERWLMCWTRSADTCFEIVASCTLIKRDISSQQRWLLMLPSSCIWAVIRCLAGTRDYEAKGCV